MIPNILSIAGSDPSGGAGIQADLKAISANGGFGMAVVTALTAQNTTGVQGVIALPADFVRQQIQSILDDIRVDAIKIGMIADTEIANAIADILERTQIRHIVLDPVMMAKGGDRLLAQEAVEALRHRLVPLASIITPNLPEAGVLADWAEATDQPSMMATAQELLNLGSKAVLLKGGHLSGHGSPDILRTADSSHWFEGVRVETSNTHGTGCTLSSALATQLALTNDMFEATRIAKHYVEGAIANSDLLTVGHGHGPTHHFWQQHLSG